jgi:hypothetical protein
MYKDLEEIFKTEVLQKGSRQRRMRFNPEKDVSGDERKTVQDWVHFEHKPSRDKISSVKMNENAKQRGLDRISKLTDVKKHPETGERMFLMHRSMGDKEHDALSSSDFNKEYTSSWSPDYRKLKDGFFSNRPKIVSAWIKESDIAHLPNAIGQKLPDDEKIKSSKFRSEHEAIVNPHKLDLVDYKHKYDYKKEGVPSNEQMEYRQKYAKMIKDPEVSPFMKESVGQTLKQTYKSEEVFRMGVDMLFKKCEEHSEDIDIEDLRKNWRKGVANLVGLLGLAHGAHYMADMPQPKSEREKSPTYQRIMEQRSQKAKTREPSSGLSDQQQIKQAYEQARQEGQSIINKYDKTNSDLDSFLETISMNESSGGKNLNHKQIKEGLHAGDSAVGQYGLMPNTIKEMAGRMGKDSPMAQYAKMDSKSIADSFKKNPGHEKEIAKFMANHLHDKFGGDENKMAYSWFQGHNLTNDHFNTSHKDYANHDYVKKYNKHKSQMGKVPQKASPEDQKVASNNLM